MDRDIEQNPDRPFWKDLGSFLAILAVGALAVTALKFGLESLVLRNDVERLTCEANYWKGVLLGRPNDYRPPGCPAHVIFLRRPD